DAYLAEWRKAAPYPVEGDAEAVAEAEAARLDTEYDQDRIKELIANDGWANSN
ncbi:MAG: virulence factor, partial [Pseudomonadota bacterium]